jgi:mannan endo-1,4-beta-mannosidase
MTFYHKAAGAGPRLRVVLALVLGFVVLMAVPGQVSPTRNSDGPVGLGRTQNSGVSYQALISALDAAGRYGLFSVGSPSILRQARPQALTAPVVSTPPSNVAATSSGTAVKVSSNDNASNEDGYQLQSGDIVFGIAPPADPTNPTSSPVATPTPTLSPTTAPSLASAPTSTPTPSPTPAPSLASAPTSTPTPSLTTAPSLASAPTSTPTPGPTSGTLSPPTSPFVTSLGTVLRLRGRTFLFVGVNRYNLLAINPPGGSYRGCGDSWTDDQLAQWFSEVNGLGVTVVRFWAFQEFTASGADFGQLDKLLSLAGDYGIKLVPVLENQWSSCTAGGYKYDTWYQSGYLSPYGDYPISYKDYVGQIVSRYKDDPRILMWQLMNEAESKDTSGNSDAQALYSFALDMSAYVKSLDPNHLVSLGTMGGGQPGTQGGDYRWIHSIPTIDLLEYHDYDEPVSFSANLAQRVEDSVALSKPLFVGEAGIKSNCSDPDCVRPDQRAALFDAKMAAAFDSGVSGYMIWSYRNAVEPPTGYMFTLTDPLAAIVRKLASLVG